jgi:uncharacterized membrane protein
VGITLVGVALVIVAFFGAVGFALLIGVKISVTIAWTLPFVILGLGVDDMVRIQALSLSSSLLLLTRDVSIVCFTQYIVLMAIKNQGGYGERHYLKAMKEVVVPVTMVSHFALFECYSSMQSSHYFRLALINYRRLL